MTAPRASKTQQAAFSGGSARASGVVVGLVVVSLGLISSGAVAG